MCEEDNGISYKVNLFDQECCVFLVNREECTAWGTIVFKEDPQAKRVYASTNLSAVAIDKVGRL